MIIAIGIAVGLISLIIQCILTAKLLDSRVEENEKKRRKTVKILSVLAIISSAIYALFYISTSMVANERVSPLSLATLCLEIIFTILVSFGILIGEKRFPKLNKIWFTVLPLTAMLLPTFITVIGQLF